MILFGWYSYSIKSLVRVLDEDSNKKDDVEDWLFGLHIFNVIITSMVVLFFLFLGIAFMFGFMTCK
jgi:hypothetical protein